MGNSVYQINKGIMRPVEFKGLKAQYIWYLGAGVVCLLIIYAVMYFIGINDFVCVAVILSLGGALVHRLYAMSNTYGEHGLMKQLARRSVPKVVRIRNRSVFFMERERMGGARSDARAKFAPAKAPPGHLTRGASPANFGNGKKTIA